MSETGIYTALTISESAVRLVADVCNCGGQENRSVWRKSGDLRNRHRDTCPSVAVLSRLSWVEREAVERAQTVEAVAELVQ